MERKLLFHADKRDFRLDWFSGTGAGGQYRNKHQNCLRLTHIPTGIVTTGQANRDRPANRRDAFQKMVKLLVAHWMSERARERYPGEAATIRTYHEPDNRVTDHESHKQAPYSVIVGKRDLAPMIEARLGAMLERQ